jgi:hypothetical protein
MWNTITRLPARLTKGNDVRIKYFLLIFLSASLFYRVHVFQLMEFFRVHHSNFYPTINGSIEKNKSICIRAHNCFSAKC